MAAAATICIAASLFTTTGATAAVPRADQGAAVLEAAQADDVAASRAFLTQYGVKKKDRDRLVTAALQGQLSLADTEGAVPVRVKKVKEAGGLSEISTFADGSISVVTTETPREIVEGTITPMAVTGCTVRTGSGYNAYTGCKVHYRTHVFSYGMYANFTITRAGTRSTCCTASSRTTPLDTAWTPRRRCGSTSPGTRASRRTAI